MSRASYILLAIIVLLASAAVVGWSFFGLEGSKPFTPLTKQATGSANLSSNTVRLPVDRQNPAIRSISIVYAFNTNIQEVRDDPNGLVLLTPLNGIEKDGIPEKFVVRTKSTQKAPPTSISYINNGERTPATFSALKAGQTVNIVVSYNLETKKWNTSRVGIVGSPEGP